MRIEILERWKFSLRDFVLRHSRGPHASFFLFFFSFVESVILPLPTEIVLIPLVIARARSWYYYAFIATLASVAGGIVGYFVGVLFFDVVGASLVELYGLEDAFARTTELLSRGVFSTTFIAAFTPIPWKVFTLAAGLLHAPLLLFIIASIFGRGLRFLLICYIVHVWGRDVARLTMRYFTLSVFALLALVILVAVYLIL